MPTYSIRSGELVAIARLEPPSLPRHYLQTDIWQQHPGATVLGICRTISFRALDAPPIIGAEYGTQSSELEYP
jgi:hypothetical protein